MIEKTILSVSDEAIRKQSNVGRKPVKETLAKLKRNEQVTSVYPAANRQQQLLFLDVYINTSVTKQGHFHVLY